MLDVGSQVWIRRSAADPWVIDLVITPDRDGLWTSKRDPDHVAPLEDVTWVADDGVRYLRPEVTLLYKAAAAPAEGRPRPRGHLAAAGRESRDWLREAVAGSTRTTRGWRGSADPGGARGVNGGHAGRVGAGRPRRLGRS